MILTSVVRFVRSIRPDRSIQTIDVTRTRPPRPTPVTAEPGLVDAELCALLDRIAEADRAGGLESDEG